MQRFVTTAPSAYDYGYTNSLGAVDYDIYPGRTVSARIVEIPDEHAVYQTNRYHSGLYVVIRLP